MKAIIFGSNGQDGFYLNELLKKNQVEVINVSRKNAEIIGDVSEYNFTMEIIKAHKPAYIFNFAANSSTEHSLLFEHYLTIEKGALNILECVKKTSSHTKVFIPGSGLQFKNTNKPIDELTPFDAGSSYALSRIQTTYAARYFRNTFGLNVYTGYFFNHDSPLRTEHHVNQKIVQAVQRIAQKQQEKLILGNIDVKKEFNYAGDIAEAVWMLVNQENIFEVVIGSGIAYSIKDWVSCCFALKNLDWSEYVEIKNNFMPEYSILISNPALIKSIGWQPKIGFFQLAKMMIDNE